MNLIALTVPRPRCWLLCAGGVGSVPTAGLDAYERRLLQMGQLVAVHSSPGAGDADLHRQFAALCREVAVQPVDQRALGRDEWRGVVEVVRVTRDAVGFKPLHLFRSQPWWVLARPVRPEGVCAWTPCPEAAEALVSQWQAELSLGRVA